MKKQLYQRLNIVLQSKNKTTYILLMSLFINISTSAINPGTIEGYVSDANSYKPVQFINVELLQSHDSTIVKTVQPNEEGKYMFYDVAFGKYIIRLSGLTYRKHFVSEFEITPQKTSVKFGITYLLPDTKLLNEVNIIGYKLTGIIENDKTIYTVKSTTADIAQSGLELLRQLPEVTVDYMTDDVKLAGSNHILFQVNGKKVDHNYLMQLNPKLVDKIEVSTNPGVKYDSNVDAVINLILKKNMQYGLSGRLRIDVPPGKSILSSNNASFDFFQKNIRFYIAGYAKIQRFDCFTNTERSNVQESGSTSTLIQNGNGLAFTKRGGVSYGVDWFSNENNMFNFYSSIQPQIPNKNEITSDIITTLNQSVSHKIGTNNSESKKHFYDYSLFYKHQFSKKFHEITFESYLSNRNNNDNNTSYEQNYLTDTDLSEQQTNRINLISEDNNKQWSLKTDYSNPVTEKIKLSAGYSATFTQSNTTKSEMIANFYDKINYNENRHGGYSNISWNKDNLNLQAGLRIEITDIRILHGYDTTNNYTSLLPFFSFQYKLGKKHTFRLNYRKSIQRPGSNQLSPISFKSDPYSQSSGNPRLKPSYTDRFEIMHRIQITDPMYVSYRPYISLINKAIREVNIDSSDIVLHSKYSNVSTEFEYGITLTGNISFVKWWTISPTFTYYNRILSALPEYEIYNNQHRTSWSLGVQSQITLPKKWVVFVQYNYNSPVISQQSITQQDCQLVTGFYKKLNNRFNISAYTLNPLSNRYVTNKTNTNLNNLTQKTEQGLTYSYLVVIRLGLNFNYGKEGKKLDRTIESTEDPNEKKGIL